MPQKAGIKQRWQQDTSIPPTAVDVHSKHDFTKDTSLGSRHCLPHKAHEWDLSLLVLCLPVFEDINVFLTHIGSLRILKSSIPCLCWKPLSNLSVCTFEKFYVWKIKVWEDDHKTVNIVTTDLLLLDGRIMSDFYFLLFSNFFLEWIHITCIIKSLKVVLNIYVCKPIDLFVCNFLYCF